MPAWLFYALLSAVFAALTTVFAKMGLKHVNSDLATAIRTAMVLIITWALVFARGAQNMSGLTRSNWLFLSLSAIGTGLSWVFYFRALQLGKVGDVAAIDKGSLVLTILLSFLFLREPLTPKLLLGAGLVVIGMLVIIWK